jgi:hypothetical protein
MAGMGRVLTRAIARSTVSINGSTYLLSLGFPTGRCRAKMKLAAGSAMMPGLRPNWAGQWLLPLQIGFQAAAVRKPTVASYRLSFKYLQWYYRELSQK